ncbi:hypothetical protein Tco_0078242 [Tanacetum coccineum]
MSNTLGTSYSAVAHFGSVTEWYQSQGYRRTQGIPLVNAGELPEMDPYEEVSQQGQAYPLSPAYVPDPMELDEHVLVYVLEPEHPEYHVSTDDDIQDGDEPSDDNDDDDDTDDEDGEPIEDEEEEEHLAPADPSTVPVGDLVPSARDTKTVRLKPPMLAFMEARIAEHVAAPIPPTNPPPDDIPEEDMPPRRRYVLVAPHPWTGFRAKSEDIYTRCMIHGQTTKTLDSELDVLKAEDCLRGRVCVSTQAYLSSEAHNRALLARLETLETHMSRMEWQRQRAEDDAVRQMMRIHVLEARAQIDTVEDTDSSC